MNNSFRIIFIKIIIIIKADFIEIYTLRIQISLAKDVTLLKPSSKKSVSLLANKAS